MDDFLGMLRKAADRILGPGHSYGTATDEVVTNRDAQKEFLNQQAHAPVDPNVEYGHETVPRLQRGAALEPVRPNPGKPAGRIQRAIQAIKSQNEAINKEVYRKMMEEKGQTIPGPQEPDPDWT